MAKIKHSKFKNTGLIFELLVRKLTSDTLSQQNSASLKIIKEFYNKTELSKEHKIYQSLIDFKSKDSNKIYNTIDSFINESKKLNKSLLRKEKYNLIKEIKNNYDLDDFFKSKISNYSTYASIYNLIDDTNSNEFINPQNIIKNKSTLYEHISYNSGIGTQPKEDLLKEFASEHKDIRIITYKILLEKFNSKFDNLDNKQKTVLKEYINNITESPKLKEYINSELNNIKINLNNYIKKIEDNSTKIKINEVISLIHEIPKNKNVKDNDVLNLLHYLELEREIKNII
jgi:hypothetical protein